ncbi:MAG: transcription antitermination protein NusB [Rickettsiales bacterium]
MDKYYGVNRGISYMRRSRVAALQALYQFDFYNSKKPLKKITEELFELYKHDYKNIEDKKHQDPLNYELIEKILPVAIAKKQEINEILEPLLKDSWKLEELSLYIYLILRLAIAEIIQTTTDLPVIINEYIEVTKLFENSKDAKFVNSIIETVGSLLRKNG